MEDVLKRLIDATGEGDERSLARLISHVEDRRPGWKDAMKAIYPSTGRAGSKGQREASTNSAGISHPNPSMKEHRGLVKLPISQDKTKRSALTKCPRHT